MKEYIERNLRLIRIASEAYERTASAASEPEKSRIRDEAMERLAPYREDFDYESLIARLKPS